MATRRPTVEFLDDALTDSIIDEALELLSTIGVFIENAGARSLLADAGATRQSSAGRVLIPRAVVEQGLHSAPQEITLYDSSGSKSFVVGGNHVHFDPGSAGLRIHDHAGRVARPAVTEDLVRFHRLTQALAYLDFQSTGLISSDVPGQASDAYRLFQALQWCAKPIITGTFVVEGFAPMAEMLAIVRGGSRELAEKPLAIFDACPSPPLTWTNLTTQSVIDCARAGIPSEFVAMPLTGATAPVTLGGALVQHTAENLAGLVIAELARPGAQVIFGGSPASFDMRTGNPPMGAMETMMIDCGYAQVGKRLKLPTHAYMGLSDAKVLDAQAGLESGMGALLAALAGINVVSGPGMMDYETTQSLEKLVIDNEICGMALRMIDGITPREKPLALHLFQEMGAHPDFLTHPHTLQWLRQEHRFPRVLERGNYQQWEAGGKLSVGDRASLEVERILNTERVSVLSQDMRQELSTVMLSHLKTYGGVLLPAM
jgi:trimethylamine--corrinoid protein Co-methyltransferase